MLSGMVCPTAETDVNINMAVNKRKFSKNFTQRTRLGDVAAFENRQPVTAAKFINKSSLFILFCSPGVVFTNLHFEFVINNP